MGSGKSHHPMRNSRLLFLVRLSSTTSTKYCDFSLLDASKVLRLVRVPRCFPPVVFSRTHFPEAVHPEIWGAQIVPSLPPTGARATLGFKGNLWRIPMWSSPSRSPLSTSNPVLLQLSVLSRPLLLLHRLWTPRSSQYALATIGEALLLSATSSQPYKKTTPIKAVKVQLITNALRDTDSQEYILRSYGVW
jgi:hypothetical protein